MTKSGFRIGVVGVGRMGANMARRLHELQYPIVAVYDADPQRAEGLAKELHCEAARTPARLAGLADTVITVVTDDGAMRQIYSTGGPDSLLRQAANRLFVNCATLSPDIQKRSKPRWSYEGRTVPRGLHGQQYHPSPPGNVVYDVWRQTRGVRAGETTAPKPECPPTIYWTSRRSGQGQGSG